MNKGKNKGVRRDIGLGSIIFDIQSIRELALSSQSILRIITYTTIMEIKKISHYKMPVKK